jgi:hypothetical protein
MEYIPITRNGSNLDIIDSLPIPDDLIKNIKTYCDDYLSIPINKVGYEVDEFWIKLGIETCNICRWNDNCMFIVQNAFGKTKSRLFVGLEKQLRSLTGLLDDLVCNSYPRSIHSIEYDNREIFITDIFYNMEDIMEYPVNNYKKTITVQDKKYIINFIERTNKFLNFLEENIDNLPVNVERFFVEIFYNETIKNIKQQIKKIKKIGYCDKISLNLYHQWQ